MEKCGVALYYQWNLQPLERKWQKKETPNTQKAIAIAVAGGAQGGAIGNKLHQKARGKANWSKEDDRIAAAVGVTTPAAQRKRKKRQGEEPIPKRHSPVRTQAEVRRVLQEDHGVRTDIIQVKLNILTCVSE